MSRDFRRYRGVWTSAARHSRKLQYVEVLGIDMFWYHSIKPSVAILGTSGRAQADTVGARLRMKRRSYDSSLGAIGQTGAVGDRGVRAFALHGDFGRSFPTRSWNRIWRSERMFSAAAIHGLGGSAHSTRSIPMPHIRSRRRQTSLRSEWSAGVADQAAGPAIYAGATWRYSSKDAFYAAPLIPLVLPDGSGDRSLGTEQQLSLRWRKSGFVPFQAALTWFDPSSSIERAGGSSETLGTVGVALCL